MHPYNPYEFLPPNFAALAARSNTLARLVGRCKDLDDGHKGVERPRPNVEGPDILEKSAASLEGEDQLSSENVEEVDRVYIDFQDAESSIALTEAMLEQDFGIHVSLRHDRLCPPVPNRINYIAWLQEIIDETDTIARNITHLEDKKSTENEGKRPAKRTKKVRESVRILDVGTGASCIYPILGCVLDDWEFVATDIDTDSINAARAIVDDPRNQGTSQATFTQGRRIDLHDRIHLCLRSSTDTILPSEEELKSMNLDPISWPQLEHGLLYHAVMCNPPFYRDREEMQNCLEAKVRAPSAVCLGSESEMICEGGEAAFVIRIIDESVHLKNRVLWFTSTLGKAMDIIPIVERLKEVRPESILVTEFVQGWTKRWALAWSFLPYRMETGPWHSKLLSFPVLGPYNNTQYSRPIEIKSLYPRGACERMQDLSRWLEGCSLESDSLGESALVVMASGKTWSRAARRARLRGEGVAIPSQGKTKCILCVRLNLEGNKMAPTWLYGPDKAVWDSFYSTVLLGWIKHVTQVESTPVK